ncbi:hypothetical protein OH77DRAFT_1519035 [Trametes cingulata]|nr:hypothetical protein OH77DRAFT_1519035 [Trametes cingulata]
MPKPPCPEIGHLPEIAQGVKSINFRRTTPGSIYRIVHASRPPPPASVLDPTHPALAYSPADFTRAFPWRVLPAFRLRAVPHGLLEPPDPRIPCPPYALNEGLWKGRSVNMTLLDVAPKSAGGRVVRQDTLRRFKTAISLIVTRGADVEDGPAEGERRIVFRGAEPPENWILPDWAYIIRPTLDAYSTPYAALLPVLRDALRLTAATGRRLEREWARLTARTLASRGEETEFRRLFLPSRPRGPMSPEEAAQAEDLRGALRRLGGEGGEGQEGQEGQEGEGEGQERDEGREKGKEPPTLTELFKRHSKREPTEFRTPAKLPDPAGPGADAHKGPGQHSGSSSSSGAVGRPPVRRGP